MRVRMLSIMRVRLLQRPASQIVINFSNGYRVSPPPETKLSYTVMSNDYLLSRWLRLIGFLPYRASITLNSYALSFFPPSSPMKRLANAPIYKRRMCNGHFH